MTCSDGASAIAQEVAGGTTSNRSLMVGVLRMKGIT